MHSILISSHGRLSLLRRTLFGLVNSYPGDTELVLADDNKDPTEDVLPILKEFTSRIPWTLIRLDNDDFEKNTGLKHFFNCSALAYNVAFRHSRGECVWMMGNEVIPWGGVFEKVLSDRPSSKHSLVVTTTYDVPNDVLQVLDPYGQNLTQAMVNHCTQWPLQSKDYRSDVTNYLSLTTRDLWESLGGIDERYMGGISAEDSDFVRRARALKDFEMVVSEGVSLHQSHGGKTRYYNPRPSIISPERFREGVEINHSVYHSWDGQAKNSQPWPWGELGIKDILRNWKPRKEPI